jgi:hypothetical protein
MISVFVATSGRPKLFEVMLDSLWRTVQGQQVEVIAVIDDDLRAWDVAFDFGCRINYSPKIRGALWSWNEGLAMSNGDILVPAGDDQLFHDGWLDYALESHREKLGGYGVVGMNDLAYNGNTQLATMFLFDRQYCRDVMGGIFAPPVYKYYCVDSEWNYKAKHLDRFYWDERSVVEHLHSAHGKRPVDATDGFKEDKWMEIDNRMFEDRKREMFPITWKSLI